MAKKYSIPQVVVIRNPLDCITSLQLMGFGLRPSAAAKFFVRYYRDILRLQDGFVVAFFERATADFPNLVREVNRYFGTQFVIPDKEVVSKMRVEEAIKKFVDLKAFEGRRVYFRDVKKVARLEEARSYVCQEGGKYLEQAREIFAEIEERYSHAADA